MMCACRENNRGTDKRVKCWTLKYMQKIIQRSHNCKRKILV